MTSQGELPWKGIPIPKPPICANKMKGFNLVWDPATLTTVLINNEGKVHKNDMPIRPANSRSEFLDSVFYFGLVNNFYILEVSTVPNTNLVRAVLSFPWKPQERSDLERAPRLIDFAWARKQ